MMGFVIRVLSNGFALWIASLIPFLQVSIIPFAPGGTVQLLLTLLLVGALFALVNGIIGTIIRIVTFPLYLLTLGLFSLVVNGFLLWLTAGLTTAWNWGLRVESFGWGIIAAILVSVINAIIGGLLHSSRR